MKEKVKELTAKIIPFLSRIGDATTIQIIQNLLRMAETIPPPEEEEDPPKGGRPDNDDPIKEMEQQINWEAIERQGPALEESVKALLQYCKKVEQGQ